MSFDEGIQKLEGDYNRGNFLNSAGGYLDLEQILKTFKADVSNPGLRQAIGNYLGDPITGQPNPHAFRGADPSVPRTYLDSALEEYTSRLADYTGKNLQTILSEFDEKDLYMLLHEIPLQKTGDESTDKAVDIINEARTMAILKQRGQEGLYLQEKLKNASEWRRRAFENALAINPQFAEIAFNSYMQTKELDLRIALSENERLSKGKLTDVITKSINKSSEKYLAETDKSKKAEILHKELQVPYIAIARTFYEREAEKQEKKELEQGKKKPKQEETEEQEEA